MSPNVSGWWTDERVNETVTSRYVHSHLRPNEAEFLTKAVFRDLSDDTYLEWILTKARRFFLILCEAGVPDQIFGVIDDSYGDDDLPIPHDDVPALRLAPQPDPSLDRRFYRAQFKYLIRVVGDGEHIRYAREETVPVVAIKSNTGSAPRDTLEKVTLPSSIRKPYWRRRISIGSRLSEEDVLVEIADCRRLAHQHVLSIYGSYTTADDLFVLLTPVADCSLRSFLNDFPKTFDALPKAEKRRILINWPHCLANGLAWLHTNGRHHGCIRPSRIQVDDQFRICFGQLDGDGILSSNSIKDDIEAYQYAAPERWKRSVTVQSTGSGRIALPSGGRTGRKLTLDHDPSLNFGSDGSDSGRKLSTMRPTSTSYAFAPAAKGNTTRLRLGRTTNAVPRPYTIERSDTRQTHRANPSRGTIRFSDDDEIRAMSPSFVSSDSGDNGRANRAQMVTPTFVVPPELRKTVVQTWQSAQHDQLAADVFSLGAVIMDILTVMCKHSYSAFAKHRGSKNRVAGRGGGLADSSFHANIGQVGTWAQTLHKDAEKRIKKEDGIVYKAVGPILQVIMQCLEREPRQRLTSMELEGKLDEHIRDFAGVNLPHCSFEEDDGPPNEYPSEAGSVPSVKNQDVAIQKQHQHRSPSQHWPPVDSDGLQPLPKPVRLDPDVQIPSQIFEFEFDATSETAVDDGSIEGQGRFGARSHARPDMNSGSITALPHRPKRIGWEYTNDDEIKVHHENSPPVTLRRRTSGNRSFWVPAADNRGAYHFPPPPTASPNRSLPPTPTDERPPTPVAKVRASRESSRGSRLVHEYIEQDTKTGGEGRRRSYMKIAPRRNV